MSFNKEEESNESFKEFQDFVGILNSNLSSLNLCMKDNSPSLKTLKEVINEINLNVKSMRTILEGLE